MIPRATDKSMIMLQLLLIFLTSSLTFVSTDKFEEDKYGVKYASECEVCKILVQELEHQLAETGTNAENLEVGYHLDKRDQNKKQYKTSQLRLIESLEQTCDGILHYSIHKERTDSTRFARGQSQTFSTLHGLVAKGVKVDLGIPYELWDKPSAEITHLKTQCENLMEKYESEIEDWYNEHQNSISLMDFLCRDHVLRKSKDIACLSEVELPADPAKLPTSNDKKKTEL